MAVFLALSAGCVQTPARDPEALSRLDDFVSQAGLDGYFHDNHEVRITPPTAEIVAILERFRREGRTDHLPLLVEYGLKLHRLNLQESGMARALRTEDNAALRELVRLAGIPELRSAREGGWLESQFHSPRSGGWSTYQIYLWARHRPERWTHRMRDLLRTIDASGRCGVGGDGRCHYGCS